MNFIHILFFLAATLVFVVSRHPIVDSKCEIIGNTHYTQLQTIKVNLDNEPKDRWKGVINVKKHELQVLFQKFESFIASLGLGFLIEPMHSKFWDVILVAIHPEYADELRGISEASNVPIGEIIVLNIFYEISDACTSIVAQNSAGDVMHARNLDFGAGMGWDIKNHTWTMSEALRSVLIQVDFVRSGKIRYSSVHYAGYIGLLTAVKPNAFSLSVNERMLISKLSDFRQRILTRVNHLKNLRKWPEMPHLQAFITRDIFNSSQSYVEALARFRQVPLIADVYFIIAGPGKDQGCVVTRSRTKSVDTHCLDAELCRWFVLETNYDRWLQPPFFDDRRYPAAQCLNHLATFKDRDLAGVLDSTLNVRPVLNMQTTYTSLMTLRTGQMRSYVQDCRAPCPLFDTVD